VGEVVRGGYRAKVGNERTATSVAEHGLASANLLPHARQESDHNVGKLLDVAEESPTRDDVAAAIGARRELGAEYEDAVIDSFVARLDRQIAERVDQQVAERVGSKGKAPARTPATEVNNSRSFVLGVVSMVAGIPITVLSSENAGVGGLLVAWGGIAAVNFAHALSRRRAG
jgi:hypothetical protein